MIPSYSPSNKGILKGVLEKLGFDKSSVRQVDGWLH